MKCVNKIEAFKLRIEDDQVMKYDLIHVSPTIGRKDGTFGFGFFEYHSDIELFMQNAEKEIEKLKNNIGLSFSENKTTN